MSTYEDYEFLALDRAITAELLPSPSAEHLADAQSDYYADDSESKRLGFSTRNFVLHGKDKEYEECRNGHARENCSPETVNEN
ncbi:hypothetical protein L0U85_13575 [Glycomyces sp. L485]|uniref:hypothetical protein n=1 Tax=Glycomyces sp. L485 TaxID=2909235 RepID=UPI001F4A426B|nr:hypothetical protein [Glycomyces sp. L485]MCH7231875.1 hypothetical protein [Glycomyces sp. L485]